MQIEDAQREVRVAYAGGFWGQLISAIIWLSSAAVATWMSPKAGIWTAIVGGFLIYPLTALLLKLSGARASLAANNPLNGLALQIVFGLPVTMVLLVPVAVFRLNWFYPALMVLVGAHYFPFAFLYGMRAFLALGAALAGSGVAIALYASKSFSLGGWVGGAILFVFAWILRMTVNAESDRRE